MVINFVFVIKGRSLSQLDSAVGIVFFFISQKAPDCLGCLNFHMTALVTLSLAWHNSLWIEFK